MRLILSLLLLLPTFSYANTRDGLVGWWTFDDISGASGIDSSKNGYTASSTGTNPINTNCVNNNCRLFSSSGCMNTAANTSTILSGFNAGTLNLWVKLPSLSVDQRLITVSNDGINSRWGLVAGRVATKFSAFLRDGAAALIQLDSTGTYVAGIWHMVTITVSGTTGTLYVDSNADGTNASVNTTNTFSVGTTPLVIGGGPGCSSGQTSGLIDDVRIYNRALTAQEIKDLYNKGGNFNY